MATIKPFIKGITIQISQEMIAAMGGNPVTELTEALRATAARVSTNDLEKLGQHFRYRVINGEVAIDLSLEASKASFEIFNGLMLPYIASIGDIIETAKVGSEDGKPNRDLLFTMMFERQQRLRDDAEAVVKQRMLATINQDMVPTMPAQLHAH